MPNISSIPPPITTQLLIVGPLPPGLDLSALAQPHSRLEIVHRESLQEGEKQMAPSQLLLTEAGPGLSAGQANVLGQITAALLRGQG